MVDGACPHAFFVHSCLTPDILCAQGVWNQIDSNMLPTKCSYGACTTCPKYGEFPCAWYKIGFVIVGA